MRYVKVVWAHDFPDEPVVFFSELGDDGYGIRKVNVHRDGRSEWADEDFETATVGLSEVPFPAVEEISSEAGITAERIPAEDFHRAWNEARSGS